MRKIALTIEYRGTAYHGWQRQKNALSIQQVIEEALLLVAKQSITLHASGRTDVGVHAYGQVAHFDYDTQKGVPTDKLTYALNRVLPPDIRILSAVDVESGFHARFSAKSKTYLYKINLSKYSAINFDTHYNLRKDLDTTLMKKAAAYLIGTHDFATFMTQGSQVKTTIRTVTDICIDKTGEEIHLRITANGFLYNMVRIIVAQLVKVGQSKIQPEEILSKLKRCDRAVAREIAPACGLYLEKVEY